MRVLVTGALGFVGRHLSPHLASLGHEVVGVDREVDVREPEAVAALLRRVAPQAVVHLAAQSSEAASPGAALDTFRVNWRGALSLLRGVAAEAPRARVLLVGSGIAYGARAPGAAPIREAEPLRPGSPYARSKAAADRLGAAFAARGLDVVRARPFNHSGPGQPDHFALPSFARQVAEIAAGLRPPRLRVGNLDAVRDFLHVRDVVDAYARLLAPEVPAAAYNVASGAGLRLGSWLDSLLRDAGVEAQVEVDPARLRGTDALVGDPARLTAATGWRPRIPAEALSRELIDHWRGAVAP